MDLNKLNEKFYLKTQTYFNTSRQFYWDGWKKLLPHLRGESLQVLDLGCGNGRFGKFLAEHKAIDYTGVDNNQYLLNCARQVLPQARLIQSDLTKTWRIKDKFDLIVLMAVLHHIPGKTRRLDLLNQAKKLLTENGLLVFTVWHFNKLKRFNSHVVNKLPGNDYILDWKKGVTAQRYVHLFDDQEINWLVENLKLQLVDDFIADGHLGQGNRYLIFCFNNSSAAKR